MWSRRLQKKLGKKVFNLLGWLTVFITFNISLIIFRSSNVIHSLDYLTGILTLRSGSGVGLNLLLFVAIFIFLLWEWITRNQTHPLSLEKLSRPLRYSALTVIYLTVILAGRFEEDAFIYFQF